MKTKSVIQSQKILSILLFFAFPSLIYCQELADLKTKAEKFLVTNQDSCLFYWNTIEQKAKMPEDSFYLFEALMVSASIYKMKNDFPLASKKANKLLLLTKDKEYIWSAYNIQGTCIARTDLEAADSLLNIAESIAIQVEDKNAISVVNSNRSSLYQKKGDLYQAIDYGVKALETAVYPISKMKHSTDLADLFTHLKNYNRAEEYILKAIDIAEQNNFKGRTDRIAMFYGNVLMHKNEFQKALIELDKAIESNTKKKDSLDLAHIYRIQAEVFIKQQKWDAANVSIQKAMKNFDGSNPSLLIQGLVTNCKILLHQEKYAQVISDTKKVIELNKKIKSTTINSSAHLLRSEAFEKLHQFDQAHLSFKIYHQIQDSLFQTEQVSFVNNLEATFNRKEQEIEIALLDTKTEAQATQLSLQQKIILIGSLSLIAILGLLFSLIRLIRKVKSQNQTISKSLVEKDTLLREIHHRVKNNLQLVSSLLSLQSRHVEDPTALEVLNSGKSRVKSMALIHQDLYNRENLTGVSVKDYIEKLCRELLSTYEIDTNRIELKMAIDEIHLDIDTLVPLGLIMNELLTNALKYAFPNNRKGLISILLFEKDDQLKFEIKDNGVGIDHSKKTDSSFGYKLINTLLYQLQGNMKKGSSDGTQIFLTFDNYKIAA